MANSMYITIALVCALVLIIIGHNSSALKTGNAELDNAYHKLRTWLVVFCLQDAVWGFAAGPVIMSNTFLQISSMVFHISTAITTFLWVNYVNIYSEASERRRQFFKRLTLGVILFQATVLIIGIWKPTIFYIDDGLYKTAFLRPLCFSLQYGIYLLLGALSLFSVLSGQEDERRKHSAVFMCVLSPILCGWFQLASPDDPYYSIGYMFGCCFIHSYIVTASRMELTKIENRIQRKFSDIISSEFPDFVWLDLEKHTSRTIKLHGRTLAQDEYNTIQSTEEFWAEYIAHNVVPDEQENMRQAVQYETVRKNLKTNSTYSCTFHTIIEGHSHTYQANFYKVSSETDVIVGFRSVDDIVRKEREQLRFVQEQRDIFNVLTGDYTNVYIADFRHDTMTVFNQRHKEVQGVQRALDDLHDYSYAEVMTDYIAKRVHPEDVELCKQSFDIYRVKNELTEHGAYSVTYRTFYNGELHYIKSIFFLVRKDDENFKAIFGFRIIDDDVKKEQIQKEELREALTKAEAASQAKTAFFFNMSHDIRTPMNAIIGFTDLLDKKNITPEQQKEYIHKIKTSERYLLGLINNLLEMARIESGKCRLDEATMDLISVGMDIRELIDSHCKEKNLTVITDFQSDLRYVFCDELKYKEICLNIISNSIKYTPEGGTITLTGRCVPTGDGEHAKVNVTFADTGIGMSKDFLPHLFDNFARERTSTESHIEGTGLGMGIVKQYLDMMGGTIDVDSTLGKGTVISIHIPVRLAHQSLDSTQNSSYDAEVDFSALNILLAEDNDINAEIAMEILKDKGATVERAEDGVICIDMLRKHEAGYYDVILMDVQMPNMDGLKATSEIRKLDNKELADIPIIAMTANAFDEDRQKAIETGMDDFVPKPIEIPKLMAALSKTIKSKRKNP